MTDDTNSKPTPPTRTQLWLTVDNVSLLGGLALCSSGAALWSVRAGLVAAGSILLGLTVLRIVLDGLGR